MSKQGCSNHKRIKFNGVWKQVNTEEAWNFYKTDVGIAEVPCDRCDVISRVCTGCGKQLGCYRDNNRYDCNTCFITKCLVTEECHQSHGFCRSCGEVAFREIRRRRNGEG